MNQDDNRCYCSEQQKEEALRKIELEERVERHRREAQIKIARLYEERFGPKKSFWAQLKDMMSGGKSR